MPAFFSITTIKIYMNAYKIIIAYDGTDFCGWQIQPDAPTIADLLQERFKAVFKKDIKIIGASRTDAGVHAVGQVARFYTNINLDTTSMQRAWNNLLPSSVLIRNITHVSEDFHPQAQVLQKTYYYHIFTCRPLPFLARYGWYPKNSFCVDKLKQALSIFVGTHDFRSFCTGYEQESTIRTIDSIEVIYVRKYKVYQISIKGPAFLRYMIRRIVGACILIASSNRSPQELKAAIDARDPQQALLTAPAHGLMLYKIQYK